MAGWIYDLFGWDNRPGQFDCTVGDSTATGIPAKLIGLVYWARASKRKRRGKFTSRFWPAESVVQSFPVLFMAGGVIRSRSGRPIAHGINAVFTAGAQFSARAERRVVADRPGELCGGGVFVASCSDVQTSAPRAHFELRSRVIAFLATKDRRIVILRRSDRRKAS